jgi:hypothetical protein
MKINYTFKKDDKTIIEFNKNLFDYKSKEELLINLEEARAIMFDWFLIRKMDIDQLQIKPQEVETDLSLLDNI